MSTIYRNPVPDQELPRRLPCIGEKCLDARLSSGKNFICPNHEKPKGKPANPGGCQTRAFLYPRGNGTSGFHFHQGIDIAIEEGLDIVAVMAGTVEHATNAWKSGFAGYGKVVVIKGDDGRYYLHAHCQEVLVKEGQRVAEQTVIAKTGRTFYTNEEHKALLGEAQPHLHFEVSRSRYPKAKVERSPEGANADAREDPLDILAQLGPWGTGRKFFLPTGPNATADRVEQLHAAVEQQSNGGYFPVGANNFWHGGVHLFMSAGKPIKAPFSGRIVAARLDEDPLYANREFGGTNFILMRHDLPDVVVKRFKEGEPKPEPEAQEPSASRASSEPAEPGEEAASEPAKPASKPKLPPARVVGRGRGANNPPDDVKEVARMLRSIPRADGPPAAEEGARPSTSMYYENQSDPVTGEEPDFVSAITSFQQMIVKQKKLKWQATDFGTVKVGGVTWQELKARSGPATKTRDADDDETDAADEGATDETSEQEKSKAEREEDDEQGSDGAEKKKEPEGTPIWMLFMHVEPVRIDGKQARKVPWLARMKVEPSKEKSPEQTKYEEDKKAFDQAEVADADEAHSHALVGNVGVKTSDGTQIPQQNLGPDVAWVKLRLKRLGFYQGATDDVADDALVQSLSAFQAQHVKICKGKGEGYLVVKRQTAQALASTRVQLGIDKPPTPPAGDANGEITIDEQFVARFRERGQWDVTKVVSDLDIEVEAGEAVWTVGHGSAHKGEGLAPLVHWEIFSKDPLFGTWQQIDDANDDLSMDACDKLMASVDQGEGAGKGDGVLTKDEVEKFYKGDGALSTRRLQCKFRGEWAAEPGPISAALGKLNVEVVGEVADVFGPYLFWKDAASVLPDDPHVWHYNPISFLHEYARICGATTGELSAEAFINQQRMEGIEIALLQNGQAVRPSQLTPKNAQVSFLELPPGHYTVEAYTPDGVVDAEDVMVREGEKTNVRLGDLPKVDTINLDNPFLDYKRMRLTRCREGLGAVTLSPHYPAWGNSGVTLGYGYDIGARSQAKVREHLEAIALPPECIESLLPAAGMNRKDGAQQWFNAHQAELDWEMTDEQRYRLLELIYPDYEKRALGRATSYDPPVAEEAYLRFHFYLRELLTDLVYVGAHYAASNGTGKKVNTILADTTTSDADKLRALREFVNSGMSSKLQPAAGKKWRLQYIDAVLPELDREP